MSKKGMYSKRCWVENSLQAATVFFEEGLITEIKLGTPQHFQKIENMADYIVMPGVIDAHVHVNEPGRTTWEGFVTATNAAAAGGTTAMVDMPLNASPVTISAGALQNKLAAANNKLQINCGFYGGLIPGNYNELEALIEGGVLGIKAFLTHSGIDEFPNATKEDLEAAMPLLAKYHLPLLIHAELSDEEHKQALTHNPKSYAAYLQSRPKDWENKAVQMMIELCRKHACKVHIVHVSSAEALSLIEEAKKEGLPITAETCPQYILFNAEDIKNGQTIFKCAPPIREKENNALLKQALLNGVLDFITTDHSPAPPAIKEIASGNFLKAWGGIAGLQFLLSASWTALRSSMPLEKFIPLLTQQPAEFLQLHQHKGFLKPGYDADICIWHPEENFLVKEETVLHRHKISPYVGRQLWGKILQTYVNGALVFDKEKIVQMNKGKLMLKK